MARSAFKAFLNLLPVLPALLVAFSCSREEYGPSAEGISYNGREDGHLVFRAAAPDTKAPAFSRDTVLTLTENGEKSPFMLKVSTGNRAVASEATKTALNPYGSDNLPERFYFRVFSQDGGAKVIDIDQAVRSGDRWISQKDWSEMIPSYVETPTICAWVEDNHCGYDYISCSVTSKIKTFCCDFVNPAHSYVCGDEMEAADHLWGYGVYSGLRADNSITFRHVNAGLCIHCAPALDMTVTQVDIAARLDGSTAWTAGPDALQDVYSYELFGTGVETLSRTINISLRDGDTWIVSKDAPVILPPQRGIDDGNEILLSLTIYYNGSYRTLEADLSQIPFYSGSMTTLEVAMDSFLWIDAPDATCDWALNGEGVYVSNPATATITTNISSSDFANRTVSYYGQYCALYEYDNHTQLRFTPKWDNFTRYDWIENYTVSCSGVSSTGTVTVKAGNFTNYYTIGDIPRYLFIGKTYSTDIRVRQTGGTVEYAVAPFLINWSYDDTFISLSDGILTPLVQTPSTEVLVGIINSGNDIYGDVFYREYEVIDPIFVPNSSSISFGSNETVKPVITSISRELRDTLVDGRRLWVIPEGMTVNFTPDGVTPGGNIFLEYYSKSSDNSITVSFDNGDWSYTENCLEGHRLDMYPHTQSRPTVPQVVSVTATGGDVAVDLVSAVVRTPYMRTKHSWKITSCPSWVMSWQHVGQERGNTSYEERQDLFRVAVLPNTTGAERSGVMTLITTDGSDLTATIAVTQAAGSGWDFGGGSGWGTGGGTEVGF